MQRESDTAEEVAVHLTKNRIVAVDIVRILAAFCVMYNHIAVQQAGGEVARYLEVFRGTGLGQPSTIFFVFAGYFACRDITWKKAFGNAWWSLAPFVLWNLVAIVVQWACDPSVCEGRTWAEMFGVGGLAVTHHLLWPGPALPVDSPLWFMRDLVVLFLLSPVLYRWAKWLFPLMLFPAMFHETAHFFVHNCFTLASPYSVLFFTLGCFLRTFSKEDQKKILTFYSPAWLLVYLGFIVLCTADRVYGFTTIFATGRHWYFIPSLFSLVVLYWTARLIEEKIPRATSWALKLAPVTFLTFATHAPVYVIMWRTCPDFFQSCFALLVPPMVFASMAVFFFALKRWFPAALHLVAHYKLRPDDVVRRG